MADCPENNESLKGSDPTQLTPNSPIINEDTDDDVGGIVGATSGAYFDVNKMVSATQNYLAINKVVNEMFGYEVKWFRAVPQQRSKDVIFQEYTLYNVEECPYDIKVVLPDGNMPDSKYNYDLMGLEYEIPLEIHIDKKYWESIVGFGTGPQKRDIIYFSMPNKLYEVESAFLYRGFMEQETTWKINLTKYQPRSSRREKDALENTIDSYTTGVDEIFGEAIDDEIKKAVDDTQFSPLNATSEDKYKSFDVSLNTITNSILMYGTVVAESYYDLQTSSSYDAITYNGSDIIGSTMDRAISAWIMPRTIQGVNKEYNVSSISSIVGTLNPSDMYSYDASLYSNANYTIDLNANTPILLSTIHIDDYVVIYRPGALNLYAKVVAISTNPLQFHCNINSFVLEDLASIDSSTWYTRSGYKLMLKEPISVIDGVNDFNEHILSVNIHANQYIAINYGHTYSDEDAYVIRLDDKLEDDKWYGLVVNIGNSWTQYNVNVWEKHDTDKNAKLKNVFTETLRLYPEDMAIDNYTVNKSPAYLTNLRLFNETIEYEKQPNELLSYFSQDGDKIILSDNGDAMLRLPYISKHR